MKILYFVLLAVLCTVCNARNKTRYTRFEEMKASVDAKIQRAREFTDEFVMRTVKNHVEREKLFNVTITAYEKGLADGRSLAYQAYYVNEQQALRLGLRVDDCVALLNEVESHWRKIAQDIKVIEEDTIFKNFSSIIREKLAEPMKLALDEIQKNADSCAENIKNIFDAMRGWWCLVPINVASYLTDTIRDVAVKFFEENVFKDYEGFKKLVKPKPEDSVTIANQMKQMGVKVNQCIGKKLDSVQNNVIPQNLDSASNNVNPQKLDSAPVSNINPERVLKNFIF